MSEVPRRLRRDTAVAVFPRARYVSLLASLAVYGIGQRVLRCHFPDDFTLSQCRLLCSEDASGGVVARLRRPLTTTKLYSILFLDLASQPCASISSRIEAL